jgi:hypothetical protein
VYYYTRRQCDLCKCSKQTIHARTNVLSGHLIESMSLNMHTLIHYDVHGQLSPQTSNTGHHLLMHSGSQHSFPSERRRWPKIKVKITNTRKWREPMPRRSTIAPKWQLNFRSVAQCRSWAHSSLPKARPMRSFNVLPVAIYTNVHVDRQRKIEVNTQWLGSERYKKTPGWGRAFTYCFSTSPPRGDDSQFDLRTLLVDSCAL